MEKEMNYLSEKIQDMENSIDSLKREVRLYAIPSNVIYANNKIQDWRTEKEYLENILNFVTQSVLTN